VGICSWYKLKPVSTVVSAGAVVGLGTGAAPAAAMDAAAEVDAEMLNAEAGLKLATLLPF
jgi:hypothetical protein